MYFEAESAMSWIGVGYVICHVASSCSGNVQLAGALPCAGSKECNTELVCVCQCRKNAVDFSCAPFIFLKIKVLEVASQSLGPDRLS